MDRANVREGMRVYSGEGRELGTIERIDGDSITVNGQQYEFTSIERMEGDRLYLTRQVGATAGMAGMGTAQTGGAVMQDQGEVRVPVHEERLDVQTRPAELGEVQVRKTVEQEQQTVPVELRREEVNVERRDVDDRPAGPGEAAFREETIRVPVRGEEAVATKETVVTGEVVVEKEQTTERQQVTDTVRRERVEADENVRDTRAGGAQASGMATEGATAQTGTAATMGAAGAATGAGAGRAAEGMDVVGSDGETVGRVKEVRDGDFLIDRPGARDVYAPFSAIREVSGNQVTLTVASVEVDDQGWTNPSLFG